MHVFVSHSRINSSTAFQLCEALGRRDVQTWLDVRDLKPGAEWNDSVISAIGTAAGFIFLIGPPDAGDRWQTFEWQQVVEGEYYLDTSRPLIPVLIGEPEIPGFLKSRKVLKLENPAESLEEIADNVVEMLRDPSASLDEKKIAQGREARLKALKGFREYSLSLGEEDIRQAGLRGTE
jgi:hypothetical protein